MSAQIIMFVPRPNPNRKEPPAFDAYDHRTIDYSNLVQTTATHEPPCEPDKTPA